MILAKIKSNLVKRLDGEIERYLSLEIGRKSFPTPKARLPASRVFLRGAIKKVFAQLQIRESIDPDTR